jgi:hypothetical protein
VALIALLGAGGYAFLDYTDRSSARAFGAAHEATRLRGAVEKGDYAGLLAGAAPSFRAAVPEAELKARLEAFQAAHGKVAGGFGSSIHSGLYVDKHGPHAGSTAEFWWDFEKARQVPVEVDVEDEGGAWKLKRFALRTDANPLELPPPEAKR